MVRKSTLPFIFILTFCLTLLAAGCGSQPPPEIVTSQAPAESEMTVEPPAKDEESVVITPTPRPTATPGIIEEIVNDLTAATGTENIHFLGLYVEDWINLGISLLFVLLGITIISHLVILVIRRFGATTSERNRLFLEAIETQIRWLVGVFSLQYATTRLLFLSVDVKETLGQIYFVFYVIIASLILVKLLDFSIDWFLDRIPAEEDTARFTVLLPLVRRTAILIIFVVAITIIMDRFGVNVIALTTVLGIGGLALSLAAQDTLADAISGYIILLDQPFRIGDRIEIQGLDTWGDVVDIGARTTRIRTRDNRMVIVPNSTIGKSQIVNYTFPDPNYRVQIEIGIGYTTEIENIRRIITEAVRGVDGVLPDSPVDALFLRFGDTSMIFRVRWWIDSYTDTRRMFDKVNEAMYKALSQAGVEMPFITYDINLKVDPQNAERLSQRLPKTSEGENSK